MGCHIFEDRFTDSFLSPTAAPVASDLSAQKLLSLSSKDMITNAKKAKHYIETTPQAQSAMTYLDDSSSTSQVWQFLKEHLMESGLLAMAAVGAALVVARRQQARGQYT